MAINSLFRTEQSAQRPNRVGWCSAKAALVFCENGYRYFRNSTAAKATERGDNLAGLQDGNSFPCSGNCHGLRPDELTVQLWFALFKKHFNNFFEIGIQFIQRRGLTVSPWEARHVAHVHAGVRAPLDDRCVCFHAICPFMFPLQHQGASLRLFRQFFDPLSRLGQLQNYDVLESPTQAAFGREAEWIPEASNKDVAYVG